jgi:hypothetical protein
VVMNALKLLQRLDSVGEALPDFVEPSSSAARKFTHLTLR